MTPSGTAQRCRECGFELPPGTPGGHCPQCLLGLALTPEPGTGTDAGSPPRPRSRRLLGDYELLSEIAAGGMGVVWRARELGLNRIVALKTLHAGSLASAAARLRFRLEVEAVARLNHPHIVSLLATGEHDGIHFYTMNVVEGGDLAGLLADPARRPPLAALLRLVTKVARAVHYAHQHGILHRDLKPSNILVDPHGEPLIADFGLARSLLESPELTGSGAVVGSPQYMAPEQANGDPAQLSTAADVYSLGAILFEVVARRPPFLAATPLAVLDQVRHADPPPPTTVIVDGQHLPRSVARDLDTIVLKCLRKDPSARYASALELAEELERWLRGEPILARPVRSLEKAWRWCRREPTLAMALAAAVLLLFLVAGGAVLHGWRMDQAHRRIAAQAQQLSEQNTVLRLRESESLFNRGDAAQAVATLARLVRADPSNRVASARLTSALQLRTFSRPRYYPLEHPRSVLALAISGDATRGVSLAEDGVLRQWDLTRGLPNAPDLRVADAVTAGALDAAGHYAMAAHTRHAALWNVSERRVIADLVHPGNVVRLHLDDGRWVTADDSGHARLWRLEDGTPLGDWVVADGPLLEARCLAGPQPGLVTATAMGQIQCWNVEPVTLRWRRIVRPDDGLRLAVSPDGTQVAVSSGSTVVVCSAATGDVGDAVRPHEGEVRVLHFSPDGRTLAVATSGPRGHALTLHSLSRTAAAPIRVTWPQEIRHLAFRADGRRIAVASMDRTVRVLDTGSGAFDGEPLQHSTGVHGVHFSPDGRSIASACFGGTLWFWDLADPPPVPALALEQPVTAADFAPGGRHLAAAGEGGNVRVWNLDQPAKSIALPGHQGRVWCLEFSPDGRQLATSGADGIARVTDLDGRNARRLVHAEWNWVMSVRFDPTGKRVATTGHDRRAIIWDLGTAKPLVVLPHAEGVNDARFSPDGRHVVTRSKDSRARLWEAATGRLVSEAIQHSSWVDDVRFSPDGQTLLTASRDTQVHVWEVARLLAGGPVSRGDYLASAAIIGAEFRRDGRGFLTVAEDQSARVWEVGRPHPILTVSHDEGVFTSHFDRDGDRIVTAAGAAGARVWDARTGQPLSERLRHAGPVRLAGFSPDNRRVFTAGEDGFVRLWPAPVAPPMAPPWLPDFAETLIVLRGDSTLGFTQAGLLTWPQLAEKWGKTAGFDPRTRTGFRSE